jgi:hypothetical protein
MKVLDLRCAQQHSFEGWFASEDDFQAQLARGQVACPLCGDTSIAKLLTAARLNLGARSEPREPAQDVVAVPTGQALQAAWMKAVREVMANTEDVGERFAEEARRIHYGETDARSIRGKASQEETASLLDEGIEVMPLALPPALKDTLQ